MIANTTPPGHELIIKYHRNGRVKERGLMKGNKKNGEWVQYDFKGVPLRKSFYEMGQYLDILEDPERSLTVNDLGRPELSKKFKRNFEKVPNFGFSKSAHWARFYLKNLSSLNKDWLLSFNYYNQDKVTFYRKTLEGWEEIILD